MKRNAQKCDGDMTSVNKTWPIFSWEFCVVCKKEFRREWGWRHITYGYRAKWNYVCCECCPTEDNALDTVEKYVLDYKKRMRNLKPPTSGSSVTFPPKKPELSSVRVINEGDTKPKQ